MLEPAGNSLHWVIARLPFDIAQVWPHRKGLRVRGEIAAISPKAAASPTQKTAYPFRTALFPDPHGTGKVLVVNRKMQLAAGVAPNQKVRIRLEPDLEDRPAQVPPELAAALKQDRSLRKWFDALSYYNRKTMGALVSQPRSAEARQQRAEKIAEWLMLAMEGERELPPILLGIFHYQSAKSRETRTAQAVKDALRVAKSKTFSET